MSVGVDPAPPLATDPDAPRAAIERAEQLIAIRRYTEALPWLGRAIAADAESPRAHCLMALALIGLGDFAKAIEAAGRAAAADPHDEWPHRLRSIALLETGRRRGALQAAREAVRLGPAVPAALFTLVQAQLSCGKTRDAEATGARLAQAAPHRTMTFRALAHIAMWRKDWTAAEAHLRRALALDPESYEAMNDLGLVLHEWGRAREAIDRLHDAVKVSPARSEAHENLHAVMRRFLRPRWIVPAAIAAGAAARAVPRAEVSLPLALGLVVVAYLWWRRRRLRALPPSVIAISRLGRAWWRYRFPPDTMRLIVSCAVLLWAIAVASAVTNRYRFLARDRALVISSLVVATAAVLLAWLRRRASEGGNLG